MSINVTEKRRKALQFFSGDVYRIGRGVVHQNVISTLWWYGWLDSPSDWPRSRIMQTAWIDVPFRASESGLRILDYIKAKT